jgi:5-methylcytosine-specific restriction endonuclease McrA
MIEKVNRYFETLERLSTEELDHSVEKLVRTEKRNMALVIAHIAEMARRKGHLERGYKNLFEYCTRRLHLSEGSVALRIQVANVCRRFPQILLALAENRMSLTVAGLLAPVLTESNVEELLADCGGMTKREAEEYLVALRPKPVFAPSIRKTPSRPQEQAALPQATRPPATSPRTVPRVSPSILEPARPELFNFRFAADRKFKEKFERLAEVLGVENPLQHMAEIMEQALDIALDKKDLKRKRARRLEREATRSGKTPKGKSRPGEIFAYSRYIPSEVRERVHERANHQCEYRAPDGTRCRSRTGLEIEHQRPFSLYRSHDERHLRLFCRRHNRLSADKVFGAAFIQEKIDACRRNQG